MLRYACCAVRLKTGVLAAPVIPGAAANAAGARNSVVATTSARRSFVLNVDLFIFFGLIASLLIAGVAKCAASHGVADMDLGHQTTEIFCVVREVIELWGIKEVGFASSIGRPIGLAAARIQDRVERFSTTQRDRVGPVFRVHPGLIAQQLGVPSNDVHRNAQAL